MYHILFTQNSNEGRYTHTNNIPLNIFDTYLDSGPNVAESDKVWKNDTHNCQPVLNLHNC